MDPREFQFVMYGLGAAWVLVTAYVVSIVLRERRLRNELDRVRQMVEDSGKAE
jgi:CcmD family protein